MTIAVDVNSILNMDSLDAEIRTVKARIAELEEAERMLKFSRTQLEHLERVRKCNSMKLLSR